MSSIIDYINTEAENIKKEDIDSKNIVNDLITYYKPKINSLAYKTYDSTSNVSRLAFESQVKDVIQQALDTYLFGYKHWKKDRDINTYLLTCLNRLSSRILHKDKYATNVPVCPACRHYGDRQYLRHESKLLKCDSCAESISYLEDKVNKVDRAQKLAYESRLRLHKIFETHSRKGYKCPDCSKFIPASYIKEYGVSCPYDNCAYFGQLRELRPMTHPLGVSYKNLLSLDNTDRNNPKLDFKNLIPAQDVSADVRLEILQDFESKLNILDEVLIMQKARLCKNNMNCPEKILLKKLMYETYQAMIKKYPEDMISYLVHLNHAPEDPIQSKIFQQYISIVENHLPFSIYKNGSLKEIFSLQDPNLNLFLGVSEFNAIVTNNSIIPNNTIETYNELKKSSPCFIGYLIDVIDLNTDKSIKNKVLNYSFVDIKMHRKIEPGTKVAVTHLRIPPHYEMMGMVNLQRIRRKIVDSVYFKINGVKRPTKGNVKSV